MACVLGIVTSFTTNLYAQKSIEDYKRDFSKNILDLDPIEGLYEVSVVYVAYNANGKAVMSDRTNCTYIIRSTNGTLRFFCSDEKQGYGSGVLQKTTANGYIFIDDNIHKGKQNLQFENSYDFSRVVNVRLGASGYYTEKWLFTKMYPTAAMYSEALKKRKQEKIAEEQNVPTTWTGSGFALNKGHLVTNYHVVEDAKSISVSGINGDFIKSYQATVVATDKVNDLAILKINDNNFTGFGTLPYSIRWQMAEVGDDVFVLGYPLTQTMGEEIKLTNGIISSRTGFQGDASLYQMSAPIQPGNSGGPMFDNKGNVIGIVCAQHRGTENVGYAIKTSYLKNLAESFSLTNIFPTNNTVSTLTLSGQVKKLKNYVYLIKCSSNSDNSNAITINIEDSYYIIETQSHIFKLLKIEISDTYTKIYKKITPKNQPTWINCSHKQFIEDAETGVKYYLRNSSIEIEPSKTILNSKDDVEIVETYPALGEKTKYILISSGSRYYNYYGYYRIKIRD